MPKFIKPLDKDSTKCLCLKCKDSSNNIKGKELLANNVYLHIESDKHRENTSQSELKELNKLIQETDSFQSIEKKNKAQRKKKMQKMRNT